ncbi:MAG: ABC transporter ATP-binding protein [Actinomycetota bacterium]|nr:ABC transporter ATP-binding protein [Actinomycetota bacterium]
MLAVSDLRKSFGGVRAVDGLDLEVREHEIVGLIGPNGAGKTTAFNLITGALRPDGGSVRLRGVEVAGFRPHEIARRGLIRSFQVPRIFERMTVLENMLLAARDRSDTHLLHTLVAPREARMRESRSAAEAMERLERFGLDHLAQEFAGVLSGGQRKLLGLARALMAEPTLLLLDEPAAGVNPALAGEIAARLLGLRAEGITLLVVEHNLGFLGQIADRVVVMAEGQVLTEGSMAEVRRHHEVLEAYLGRSTTAGAASVESPI